MKRTHITVVPWLLALALVLSACGGAPAGAGPAGSKPTPAPTPAPLSPAQQAQNELVDAVTEAIEQATRFPADEEALSRLEALLPVRLSLDGEAAQSFQADLSALEVSYAYGKLMNLDEAYARYLALDKTDAPLAPILEGRRVDAGALYRRVQENNAAFLSGDDPARNAFLAYGDNQVQSFCTIIADTLNHFLPLYPELDAVSLSQVLTELKILNSSNFYMEYGYISENRVYCINVDGIEASQGSDAVRQVAIHEAVHLMQVCSIGEREATGCTHHAFCYYWEDLPVNPMQYNWIYEGATETLAAQYAGNPPMIYQEFIKNLEVLTLSALFTAEEPAGALEALTLTRDLEQVFARFGRRTDAEKKALLRLFYALEVVCNANQNTYFQSFSDRIAQANGAPLTAGLLADLQESYRACAALDLSKLFYQGLSQALAQGQFTAEELFSVLSVFEACLQDRTWYADPTKLAGYDNPLGLEKNDLFLAEYSALQSRLFALIADASGIQPEALEEGIALYGERGAQARTIPWLTAGQNACLNAARDAYALPKIAPVQMYDLLTALPECRQ